MNPYDVLSVPPGASDRAVRAAWRRFAARHHPDHGGDAAEFAKGMAAYESLTGAPGSPTPTGGRAPAHVGFVRRQTFARRVRHAAGALTGRRRPRAPRVR